MIDISSKDVVFREARAEGYIRLREETIRLIREGKVEKGDVFTIAKVAAIQAVKKVPEVLPLCHNIPITFVDVKFQVVSRDRVRVEAIVRASARTGVEMEALTAVVVALLNVWDIVKKYEKDESGQYPWTVIEGVRVTSKTKERVSSCQGC
ncbi:MAG: cyclic pyranopterin monophosphate synthase MoaC [Desulfurococcales archaeon]|nr:cyclic pyranopterin monophosphate synthase MoaC [Desulfurococcales archaeon]